MKSSDFNITVLPILTTFEEFSTSYIQGILELPQSSLTFLEDYKKQHFH